MHNDQDRRSFLKGMAMLGGAAALGSHPSMGWASTATRAAALAPTVEQIGIQLYVVRAILATDFEGTLEQIARFGYKQVELAGYHDRKPEEIRRILDRLGMRAPSAHIGHMRMRNNMAGEIAIAETLGHRYMTIPSPAQDVSPITTADGAKRVADEFNRFGAAVKARGMKLAFHNHAPEGASVGGGRTVLDVLIAETDPALVSFQLDVGATVSAGGDPLALIERYPGRFFSLHVKDSRKNPLAGTPVAAGAPAQPARQSVPIGRGEIDFPGIVEKWQKAGLEYYFVEQATTSLEDMRISYQYMNWLVSQVPQS